jgi:hypothetical protein
MLNHDSRDFRDFFNKTKKEVKGDRDFRDFFNNKNNKK